jgi:hypothetical protein
MRTPLIWWSTQVGRVVVRVLLNNQPKRLKRG